MTCGIYRIFNVVTSKSYVGSSKDIENRFFGHKGHLEMLRSGNHHSVKLQHSWNKHGESAFRHEILQECAISQLPWLEAFWMVRLNAIDNGYCVQKIYLHNFIARDFHHSETTRKKLAERFKNRVVSEETREKLRLANLGKTLPESVRKKISLAGKGRIVSDETRNRQSKALMGHSHSIETRDKISKATQGRNLGVPLSKEHRDKISRANSNITEETRKKMSESAKKCWEARREASKCMQ